MNKFWQRLPRPIFALAPMDDVTDTAFRQLIAECGKPDVFFTEFASADGLQSEGREAVMQKLKFTPTETPLVAQIWGAEPKNYYKTTKELIKMGFNGVDINMGCPVRNVIKNGLCSALINNRELAAELIKATRDAAKAERFPVSVKTRLGYNEVDLSWIEFLLKQQIQALTIHCRTVEDMSKVPARWEEMAEVVKLRDRISPKTIIIGNGDIETRTQGEELAFQYRLDGLMVGRGIFANPWFFNKKGKEPTPTERLNLMRRHLDLFEGEWSEDKNYNTLKKFFKIYIKGFDGAAELRQEAMLTGSIVEARQLLNKNT